MLRKRYLTALAIFFGSAVMAAPSIAADISTSGGGLIVVGEGRTGPGVTVQSNLATDAGAAPLTLDELGLGIHLTSHLNDGLYGNSNSWIGNGATGVSGPYAGISFAASQMINSITFGRDNLATYNDRSLGAYTLQYRNDGSVADDGGWSTIGTITYSGSANPPAFNSGHRHEFRFDPVDATAVRLLVPGTGISPAGTAIDEIEVYAGSAAAPAPLGVSAPGGAYGANNVALATTTAIPFAQDLIGNGLYAPTHEINNINDGIYGNSNSWIGNNNPAISSFAGVNLNGEYTIDAVAISRDNGGEATTYTDRSQGAYTIQVTSSPNPTAATPDNEWHSVGVATIDGSTASPNLRRVYSFDPVSGVTGVRVITSGGDLDIDELEVQGSGVPTFTLNDVGVHDTANTVPDNLALASNGATAFAKDVIPGYPTRHSVAGINDGQYGNSASWIGATADSFLGVDLGGLFPVDAVAWGRDNGGDESPDFAADTAFTDRALGLYTLQYTQVGNPDETTPDADWLTIGLLEYSEVFPDSPSTRHEWGFDPVLATGIRLLTPAGAAVDELEVFRAAVPEPASLALWSLLGLAATLGCALRLRRKC